MTISNTEINTAANIETIGAEHSLKKLVWIDMVKGLAILSVVIGHTISNTSIWNGLIFSFHMPIFFILAGYTFKAKKEFAEFFSSKVRRLLSPYFFTIVFDLFFWLILGKRLTGDISSLFACARYTCTSYAIGLGQVAEYATVNPVGVVWFIPCLFLAEIIFYVIVEIFNNNLQRIGLTSVLAVIIGYLIGKQVFLPWSLDISLFAQIFLFSGYYLKSKKLIEKKLSMESIVAFAIIWIAGILSFPISMNNRDYSIVIVPILSAISASILIMKLMKKLENVKAIALPLQYFGEISLIVLVFHLKDIGSLHLNLIPELSFLFTEYEYFFFLILERLAISVLFAEVLRRIPFIRTIYGLKAEKDTI